MIIEKNLMLNMDECPKDEQVTSKNICNSSCAYFGKYLNNGCITCTYNYKEFIKEIDEFIKDREEMLKGVHKEINTYKNRLITAKDAYKNYCENILNEEEIIYKSIEKQLNNVKFFKQQLK